MDDPVDFRAVHFKKFLQKRQKSPRWRQQKFADGDVFSVDFEGVRELAFARINDLVRAGLGRAIRGIFRCKFLIEHRAAHRSNRCCPCRHCTRFRRSIARTLASPTMTSPGRILLTINDLRGHPGKRGEPNVDGPERYRRHPPFRRQRKKSRTPCCAIFLIKALGRIDDRTNDVATDFELVAANGRAQQNIGPCSPRKPMSSRFITMASCAMPAQTERSPVSFQKR